VTCSAVQPLLEPLLDDELDAAQQAQMREHLNDCPTCSAAYGRLQRIRESIQAESLYFQAPESLGRRVLSSLQKEARPVAPEWRWKWMAVAASIALILSLGGNVALTRAYRPENQATVQEVYSGHIRSMLGTHLVDVISSDQHTVKPWFGGKLDFSPTVKDLASAGFPLYGGRVDYLDGRPVAALVFRRAQHVINLFTWPSGRPAPADASQNGYHIVSWTKDGMTYSAVSDLNLGELKQFASLYQN